MLCDYGREGNAVRAWKWRWGWAPTERIGDDTFGGDMMIYMCGVPRSPGDVNVFHVQCYVGVWDPIMWGCETLLFVVSRCDSSLCACGGVYLTYLFHFIIRNVIGGVREAFQWVDMDIPCEMWNFMLNVIYVVWWVVMNLIYDIERVLRFWDEGAYEFVLKAFLWFVIGRILWFYYWKTYDFDEFYDFVILKSFHDFGIGLWI